MDELISFTKKGVPFVEIRKRNFSSTEIEYILARLNIFKYNNNVVTKLVGKDICLFNASKVYGMFDFTAFVLKALPYIEEFFQPNYYTLLIKGGFLQLTVYGEEININNEVFYKMFNIVSSSNGLYPLSLSVGLYRLVCSNGMIAPVSNASFNYKTKHFFKAVDNHLLDFNNRIHLIEDTYNEQLNIFKSLYNQPMLLSRVVEQLVKPSKVENEYKKTVYNTVNQLGKKFINSETDKLDLANYTKSEIEYIEAPTKFLEKNIDTPKILINKDNIFNCYIEIFRNRNASIIELESKRILTVLLDEV